MQIRPTNNDSNINELYSREFNILREQPHVGQRLGVGVGSPLNSENISSVRRGLRRDPVLMLKKLRVARLVRMWREVEKDLIKEVFDDDDDYSMFLPTECTPFCSCKNRAAAVNPSQGKYLHTSTPVVDRNKPVKRNGDVVLYLEPLKYEPNSSIDDDAEYETPPLVTMTPAEVDELERNLQLNFSENQYNADIFWNCD